MNPVKLALARVLYATGVSAGLLRLGRVALGRHVRAVNYHDVPPSGAAGFEKQLRFFQRHFHNVGRSELEELMSGHASPGRAGLILSFDDGLRSHAEVVAPLLEKYGFTGWFMIPVDFVGAAVEEQGAYAAEHHIHFEAAYPDPRVAMTWSQLRELERNHVIGCHSMSHRRLESSLSSEDLGHEIRASREALEEKLAGPVDVFAWVGGEEWSYSAEAAQIIRDVGYKWSFMTNNAVIDSRTDTLQLQRSNLESDNPASVVRLQLSGLMDLMYTAKRRRVNRLTAAPSSQHRSL